MDFLRRHLFLFVCGIVGAAGIALGVLGIGAMSHVSQAMQTAVGIQDQIQSARRNPRSEQAIAAARERIDRIADEYKRLLVLAETLEAHAQLVDGFFPTPAYIAKVEFPEKYRQELARLLQSLNPGEPPNELDFRDEHDAIDAEERADGSLFGIDSGERTAPDDSSADREISDEHPSGLITDEAARRSPEVRAAIKKARRSYCYATDDSLDVNRRVRDAAGSPPEVIDCWDAQQALWVQQDVIGALALLNSQAARRLQDQGHKPWVGNLPVKDLLSLRVSRYVFDDAPGSSPEPPGGEEPAYPPATRDVSFTGNASNTEYLVVQFTLKMVVDARDLPAIIAELSRDKFTTLFRVDYVRERGNLDMQYKIYGPEPVVNVVMDFETCFFCRLLAPSVPEDILDTLPRDIADALTRQREQAEAAKDESNRPTL